MKICPKCDKEHDKPGKFCSRSCANVRVFSEESNIKKSLALKGRSFPKSIKNKDKWKNNIKKFWIEKYNSTPFDELGPENRRRRVFEEQNHCCNSCGISEWMGKPINLELEHKDGNNKNNVRENLEALCPNCHSITDTWRGRNNSNRKEVTDEFLLKCLQESSSIRQGLLKAGLAGKGKNYERARRLLAL